MKRDDDLKIIAIVQARMGSERLPGKVIKPIIGKPLIIHVLDRLSKSKYIDDIVLATSLLDKEQPLIDIVSRSNYKIFRGEEKNVMKRYIDANKEYAGDIIVRVTGDCPLIDPQIVDNVISHYLMYNYDYVRLDVPDTFIRGFDVEVFSKEALERAYKEVIKINNEECKEHVTLYFYRNKEEFKIGYVQGKELYNKDYRLCVDTAEDYKLVSYIYEYFNNDYVKGADVVRFIDSNNELSKFNYKIMQRSF